MSFDYRLYDLFPPPTCPNSPANLAELGEIVLAAPESKRQSTAGYDDFNLE